MNKMPVVLVVDDDRHMRDAVIELLNSVGEFSILSAANGSAALGLLDENQVDLVLSDIKMPQMDGITLLKECRVRYPLLPFVVMTAYADIETAVDAMASGAFYFIQKDSDHFVDTTIPILERALENGKLTQENKRLVRENSNLKSALKDRWFYIGEATEILKIKEVASSVAESKATVLVTGESGTGKELIAKSIHAMSNRSAEPFVKINCAALPEGLIESELFGHEKGAFTGAVKTRSGKFELANGGTLLLDEIGEMPLSVQAKLLRVLQEREVDKVGGDFPVAVDVRIVATTNRDLAQEVAEGKFREDLFYRLNVFHFELPPLRERLGDIPALVDHFIARFNNENGFSVAGVEPDALKILMAHRWPGNIRELENTLERAMVLTRTGKISPSVLSVLKPGLVSSGENGLVAGMTVADAERELIFLTLKHCSDNRTRAAEMLGISIRTLRNKLTEYGAAGGDDD